MPWNIRKEGDEWIVFRTDTGEVESHHDTKELARASLRARRAGTHGWEPDVVSRKRRR